MIHYYRYYIAINDVKTDVYKLPKQLMLYLKHTKLHKQSKNSETLFCQCLFKYFTCLQKYLSKLEADETPNIQNLQMSFQASLTEVSGNLTPVWLF